MAYPTAPQMEKVRDIVFEIGKPDLVTFDHNVYAGTVLKSYGVVTMYWMNATQVAEHYRYKPARWLDGDDELMGYISVRPDGELVKSDRITVAG